MHSDDELDPRQDFIDGLADAMREVGLPVETTRDGVYINVSAAKARKEEALRLLALDVLTYDQEHHLYELIALQTGLSHYRDIPFLTSIDSCAILPLPPGATGWSLSFIRPDGAPEGANDIHTAILHGIGSGVDKHSMHAAMLYIWWHGQPD